MQSPLSKLPSKPLLATLQGTILPRPPVWLMRQAGRYLPEYRAVREKTKNFLDLCFTPELASEVTLQPLRRFSLDAAIIFSDILVLPHALGYKVAFLEGEGPCVAPWKGEKIQFDEEIFQKTLEPVYQALRQVRAEMPEQTSLIGFAGAPWTIACYMVEGKGSRDFAKAKATAYQNPEAFDALMSQLVQATILYLKSQINAGAEVIQLFDSWAGSLPSSFINRWVIEPTQKIVSALRHNYPEIPIIGFPRGIGGQYVPFAHQTGVTAVSLDTTIDAEWAAAHIPCVLQGNLDPALLIAGGALLDQEVKRLCHVYGKNPYIFNLGHGILPQTPLSHVERLIDLIKN